MFGKFGQPRAFQKIGNMSEKNNYFDIYVIPEYNSLKKYAATTVKMCNLFRVIRTKEKHIKRSFKDVAKLLKFFESSVDQPIPVANHLMLLCVSFDASCLSSLISRCSPENLLLDMV